MEVLQWWVTDSLKLEVWHQTISRKGHSELEVDAVVAEYGRALAICIDDHEKEQIHRRRHSFSGGHTREDWMQVATRTTPTAVLVAHAGIRNAPRLFRKINVYKALKDQNEKVPVAGLMVKYMSTGHVTFVQHTRTHVVWRRAICCCRYLGRAPLEPS